MSRWRFDRTVYVLGLCAAYLWSVGQAAIEFPGGDARRAIAGVGTLVLLISFVLLMRGRGENAHRMRFLIVFSALLTLLALPSYHLAWIGVAGCALMAASPAMLSARIGCAAVVMTAAAEVNYHHSPSIYVFVANELFGVLVFALVLWRQQFREANELRAAQERVIAEQAAETRYQEKQRELAAQVHDVLAHSLSGLIVTLNGAEKMASERSSDTQLRQQLSEAARLAQEGLTEARECVAVLRGDSISPSTTLSEWLAPTLQRTRDLWGMRVNVEGAPQLVPPERDALVRATVMEGLTNALRYAPGGWVRVILAASGVSVASELVFSEPAPSLGSGFGLEGLRERALKEGADIRFGRRADEFELRVMW